MVELTHFWESGSLAGKLVAKQVQYSLKRQKIIANIPFNGNLANISNERCRLRGKIEQDLLFTPVDGDNG